MIADPAGEYARAFMIGRGLAAGGPTVAAGSPPVAGATPPALSAFAQGGAAPTPAGAGAAGLGRRIASMGEDQRQAAARRAEVLASVLRGLRGASADPRQRLAMAQHLAATTPSMGVDPRGIGLADVTDQGIAGHLAMAMTMQRRMGPDAEPRYIGHATPPPPPDINGSDITASAGQAGFSPSPMQGAARAIGPRG